MMRNICSLKLTQPFDLIPAIHVSASAKRMVAWAWCITLLAGCQGVVENTAEKENQLENTQRLMRLITPEQSGIDFNNEIDERFENFFDFFAYVYNGAGVAIGDINNDDLPDIYFAGNEVDDKLYLNKGDLQFEDITESANLGGSGGWHNGVTMVDINHDSWLDIYVCRGGWQDQDQDRTNLLYINQGDGTFKESASEYNLDDNGYSNHAVFFDLDNDNDLDAYVINRPDSFYLPLSEMEKRQHNPPDKNRDKLFVNEGGKFVERGLTSGIINNYGYALSVVPADINKDGYTDLFVANDYSIDDYLYINQGDGTFKESIQDATNHISLYSMGADIADINNDGLEDLLVMEMRPENYQRSKISMPSMDVEGFYAILDAGFHKQYMHNMLHLNQGNLFFSEVSQLAGISKTDWSWACLASDFDNDGYRDLFVTNGTRRDVFDGDVKNRLTEFAMRMRGKYESPLRMFTENFKEIVNLYQPVEARNYLMKNMGDLTYEDVSEKWGLEELSFSNGAAVGDLDNDGDLDLVVNNLDQAAYLYENTLDQASNYLRLKLIGPETNPAGLGAKVTLHHGGEIQYFEQKTVRGYLSTNDPVVHFGLGNIQTVDSIEVKWTDGKVTTLNAVKANQTIEPTYIDAVIKTAKNEDQLQQKLFTEAANVPKFKHQENDFNEYRNQILLPHMFSRNGPFITTGDVDGNQREDFYVGGAAGQAGQLFLQQGNGFVPASNKVFSEDRQFEDMGAAFLDFDQDGDHDLIVTSGGSEFEEGSEWYQTRLYVNNGAGNFRRGPMLKTETSNSCIAPNDIDGDGDVDLFIGGQVIADWYPHAPRSYLFINEKGNFIDRTDEMAPELARVGMVNSATWVDLRGDEAKELVIVGEWMAVQVYETDGTKFNNISGPMGLILTEGWWNEVQAADLDQDGDMDLVLGNLGKNYKFKASGEKPFQVFANDFDGNGTNDIFLAKYNEGELVPVRGRECSSQQVPQIARQFPSYRSFANASIEEILGPGVEKAAHRKAHLFSSVILENTGGKFNIIELPNEAQFSTLNAIIAEDFNEDGITDLLIAGNKFDTEVETTPADASPGYFLKGLGNLKFKVITPMESGLSIPFNVKDAVNVTLGDEKKLIVVANNDPLRMYNINRVRKLNI